MQEDQPDRASNPPASGEPARPGRALAFASEHPLLAVLGVAGLGLLGGAELAVGVLIGAGAAAALRAGPRRASRHGHGERGRARTILDRVPGQVRARARAVVQAARGEIGPAPQGPGDEISRSPAP
jgi:hypothetical protein